MQVATGGYYDVRVHRANFVSSLGHKAANKKRGGKAAAFPSHFLNSNKQYIEKAEPSFEGAAERLEAHPRSITHQALQGLGELVGKWREVY